MITALAADDILVGLFNFLPDDIRINADRQSLHEIFFKLKEKEPSLMEKFSFRNRGLFQESGELDQAFSNLDASGLIARYNLVPRYYTICPSMKETYDHFSKEILKNAGIDESKLKEIASILETQLADSLA